MAEVITRLKVDNQGYDQKIKKAQQSLDQFGLKGTEVGQKMSGLSRVMSLNIGTLSKWSVGLGAASAALKVAGDAFKLNEERMDEWNGIVDGAKGVYESFLDSLNTGDFTGFFSRMGAIATAAREAYDALDRLGTFNAFNQIQIEGARTDFTEAIAGYRSGESTKADVEAAANELKKELETRRELEQKAYDAEIKKLAATRKVNYEDLKKALTGEYGDYETLRNTPLTGVSRSLSADMDGNSIWLETPKAANETERLGEVLRQLNDTELQNIQALGAQAQRTATEIATVDKQTARVLTDKKTTTTKVETPAPEEGSIDYQTAKVKELRAEWTAAATDEARALIKVQLDEANEELDRMMGKVKEVKEEMGPAFQPGSLDDLQNTLRTATTEMESLTIGTTEWAAALERVRAAQEAVNNAQSQINGKGEQSTEVAKNTKSAWSGVSSAIGSVGSALSGLEDPGAKVAGIIAAAIAQVAAGLGSMLAQPQSTSQSWGWIALAASGAATMVGTIAAIKQATEYHAEGGIAGLGNIFQPKGTDVVPAMLTVGEEVLPASSPRHINNIGSLIGQTQQQFAPYVDAELIFLGLNNFLQRTGRGEIVTSRR